MADKKPDQFYTRPPKLSTWESFKIFLWNSETSQFLGRTGASWGKIILFYVLFYAALIGFFAAMLAVFYQTLDPKQPKYLLDSSLIGDNPGLGFRPMPPDSNVESTLIWYKANNIGNFQYWRDELASFLATYTQENRPHEDNIKECGPGQVPPAGTVCDVQLDSHWFPCLEELHFNYNSTKNGPCIFLKLNKIYGWNPIYYNNSDHLPHNMPAVIKQNIKKYEESPSDKALLDTVWVSCEGENVADMEHVGEIVYYPSGFQSQYFPFKNQDGYLSPIVSVYFKNPARGVIINIECKAWAQNIHHDRADRRGSVHFELLID